MPATRISLIPREDADMWRGGCIFRSVFPGEIKKTFEKNQELENAFFRKRILLTACFFTILLFSMMSNPCTVPFVLYRELMNAFVENLVNAMVDHQGIHCTVIAPQSLTEAAKTHTKLLPYIRKRKTPGGNRGEPNREKA